MSDTEQWPPWSRLLQQVRTHGVPELREAVQTGVVSLVAAADIAQLPEEKQREAVAKEQPTRAQTTKVPHPKRPGVNNAVDDLLAHEKSCTQVAFHCRQLTAAVKLAQLRKEKQQTPKPGDCEPADFQLPLEEALAKQETTLEVLTRRIKRVDPRLPRKITPAARPRWPGPFQRPDVPALLRTFVERDEREHVQKTGRLHLVARRGCLVAKRAAP